MYINPKEWVFWRLNSINFILDCMSFYLLASLYFLCLKKWYWMVYVEQWYRYRNNLCSFHYKELISLSCTSAEQQIIHLGLRPSPKKINLILVNPTLSIPCCYCCWETILTGLHSVLTWSQKSCWAKILSLMMQFQTLGNWVRLSILFLFFNSNFIALFSAKLG